MREGITEWQKKKKKKCHVWKLFSDARQALEICHHVCFEFLSFQFENWSETRDVYTAAVPQRMPSKCMILIYVSAIALNWLEWFYLSFFFFFLAWPLSVILLLYWQYMRLRWLEPTLRAMQSFCPVAETPKKQTPFRNIFRRSKQVVISVRHKYLRIWSFRVQTSGLYFIINYFDSEDRPADQTMLKARGRVPVPSVVQEGAQLHQLKNT